MIRMSLLYSNASIMDMTGTAQRVLLKEQSSFQNYIVL